MLILILCLLILILGEKCWSVFPGAKSWIEANSFCRTQNQRLITFDSYTDYQLLDSIMTFHNIRDRAIFVGLRQLRGKTIEPHIRRMYAKVKSQI